MQRTSAARNPTPRPTLRTESKPLTEAAQFVRPYLWTLDSCVISSDVSSNAPSNMARSPAT